MSALFNAPQLDADGVQTLSRAGDAVNDMMMDIDVYHLKAGGTRTFLFDRQELAVLLVTGELNFAWEGQQAQGKRGSFVEEGPYCLHVCVGVEVTVTALADSEVLAQRTANDRPFTSVFYTPSDCRDDVFGKGVWDNKMERTVRTIFDYQNAPYSNMVNGEVINHQGGWSSYSPHSHLQPEVYYYRFERPEGFGACFIGEDVFKITDRSWAAVESGKTHPQVTAPAYPMYYCWMIRHLEDNPWTSRTDDPRYTWIAENPK